MKVNEKCKLNIFKTYFNRTLLYGAEIWTTAKIKGSKMEIKLLRTILNKTKKDWIRNINIRLELGKGR